MSDKNLALTVKFGALDMLSPALKSILGITDKASVSLKKMSVEAKTLERQLRDVRAEMTGATGNVTALVEKENALTAALARTNKELTLQKGAMARTKRFDAMAQSMRTSGTHDMMIGGAVLYAMKGPIEEASKYQIQLEKLHQMGLGDVAVSDAEKFVRAQKIMGASRLEMMTNFAEAQGIFRESGHNTVAQQLAGAKLAAPMMAKIGFASKILDSNQQESVEASKMDMLRFVEQAGGLSSPKKFNELMNAGFKAIQSSGGNVDWTQYRTFMAKAQSAGFGLSGKSLFSDLEPIIGEMKGAGAGASYMAAWSRMHGIVAPKNPIIHEMIKMGLWDAKKVEFTKQGGIQKFNGDPLKNSQLFNTSPAEWFRTTMQPMLDKQGLKGDARITEIGRIFGIRGGAFFNLIDKQMPTILKSREAYKKARGIDDAKAALEGTYAGKIEIFKNKWHDFELVLGKNGGVLDMAIAGLTKLTSVVDGLTNAANAHPTIFGAIVKTVTTLAAFSFVFGALKVGISFLLGPFVKLFNLFDKFKKLGGIAMLVEKIAPKLAMLRTAFMFLASGVMRAGLMMLANPVVLAIVAVVAVLAFAAYEIHKHWGAIKGYFVKNWTHIRNLLLGALVIFFPLVAALVWVGAKIYQHWGQITKWISTKWHALSEWFTKWGPTIFKTLFPLTALFFKIGGNLLSGLWDGIKSKWEWLKKGISNLGDSVGGWFADQLGIKSPSRVFMAFGGHITDGLAIGLQHGAHRPERAMRRLTHGLGGAAALGLSGAALAAGGGAHGAKSPITMNITINISQNAGESQDALAKRIADAITRQQTIAARASYEDM